MEQPIYLQEDFSVLFVDDETSISTGLQALYEDMFNIKIATSVDEAIDIANQTEIGIAVVDYEMPGKNGMEFMKFLKIQQPFAKLIMLTGHQEQDIIKEAINTGKVNYFINKPINFDEFEKLLIEYADLYLMDKRQQMQIESYEAIAKKYQEEIESRNKVLFDVILNIDSQNAQIISSKISNVYLSYVDIIRTKMEQIQKNYMQTEDIYQLEQLLRDLEIFAVEFEITELQLLFELISIHFKMLTNHKAKIVESFDKIVLLMEKINDEAIVQKYKHFMQFLTIMDQSASYDINAVINDLFDLFDIDISSIVENTMSLSDFSEPDAIIGYIIIVKGQFPIYTKVINPQIYLNPDLISNFFVAISLFTKELFHDGGSINTISHDRGVIMTQSPLKDVTYICIVDTETLKLRISFKEFVNSTYHYIEQIEEGIALDEENEYLQEALTKYLNI